eukprot:scaffold2091_cov361-Prasinococcus_capsulatus_cf.AAC.1
MRGNLAATGPSAELAMPLFQGSLWPSVRTRGRPARGDGGAEAGPRFVHGLSRPALTPPSASRTRRASAAPRRASHPGRCPHGDTAPCGRSGAGGGGRGRFHGSHRHVVVVVHVGPRQGRVSGRRGAYRHGSSRCATRPAATCKSAALREGRGGYSARACSSRAVELQVDTYRVRTYVGWSQRRSLAVPASAVVACLVGFARAHQDV